MKYHILLTIAVFLFFPLLVLAQSKNDLSANGISLSYMGSINSPGFKVGYVKLLNSYVSSTDTLKISKSYSKERYLSYNLGMYHHPTFHNNIFTQIEWNIRRQRNKGFFFEFAPGAGLSRTFLSSPTFEVDNAGNVSKVPMAGNFYALLSVSGSMGYNFSLRGNLPGKVFLKPSLNFLLPYNKLMYTRPTVEVGYSLNVR